MSKRLDSILSVGTLMVLFLFALVRVLIEISYSSSWGYNTASDRAVSFAAGLAVVAAITLPSLIKLPRQKPQSLLFKCSFAAVQFIAASLFISFVFNSGTFSGNTDIRMILLNAATVVAFALVLVLFILKMLFLRQTASKPQNKTFLLAGGFVALAAQLILFGLMFLFGGFGRSGRALTMEQFIDRYSGICLTCFIAIPASLTMTIIKLRRPTRALAIAGYALAVLCATAVYVVVLACPDFAYATRGLRNFYIYGTFVFVTAVTFAAIWSMTDLFVWELGQGFQKA